MKKLWNCIGTVAFWCAWPALRIYLSRGARTRVLIRHGDEIVVLKNWLGINKWALPGGGLHRGEDPRAGAVREVREETGISLEPAQLTPLMTEQYRGRGFRFRCHYFVVDLPSQPVLTPQFLEVSTLQWRPARDCTQRNASQDVMRALAAAISR